ncbi:DUF3558 domain-containing protein [Nocardia iowensis]|uniref:DUF3558 domain-containing protein n=2 Tax=Nocardia iowensis TaxID=204891 RepID=A0ABX8S170_NOCIO|nr:DUF3558 domain-containing protein [Nocardia iowensis]
MMIQKGAVMIPFSVRNAGLAVIALAGLLTGCSSGTTPEAARTAPAAPFADCAPLSTQQISDAVHADRLIAQHTLPACRWAAQIGAGGADISFTFSATDSLQQLWDRARSDGFQTEHMVITKHALGTVTATAFYVRDPHDPTGCAVVAASNGAITWRVQNLSRTTSLDPCAASLELATMMVDLSP